MILSEFAGAAQSLNGSIIVNPWDSQEVADAILEAVTTPPETRKENQRKLFKYISKYSSAYWGTSFVKEMSKIQLNTDGVVKAPEAISGSSAVANETGVDTESSVANNATSVDPTGVPKGEELVHGAIPVGPTQ